MRTLAGQVAARDKLENERLSGLEQHVDEVKSAEKLAEGDHRRLAAGVTELRRLVGKLRLDEAQEGKKRIDGELAEAKTAAEAWRECATVLNHLNASRKARDFRELVGNREQKAQPALQARNAAAAALARGLLALAKNATEQAAKAEAHVGALRAEAEKAQAERDESANLAASRRAEARGWARGSPKSVRRSRNPSGPARSRPVPTSPKRRARPGPRPRRPPRNSSGGNRNSNASPRTCGPRRPP